MLRTNLILTISVTFCLSSCALVTVPVKVAGKVAKTTVGLAGKAVGGGVKAIVPNKKSSGDN